MISGIILCCLSVGAIVWVLLTTLVANPNNAHADMQIVVRGYTEKLFSADSDVVQ